METRKRFAIEPPSEEILSHFSTPNWASQMFKDPSLTPISNESRVVTTTTGNTFCAVTLNSPSTIISAQNFYRTSSPPSSAKDELKITEMVQLVKLGSGLNGHIDTCHGGFVGVLLDEIIGNVADSNRPSDKATMTAYLNIQYKKPVRTPCTVLCRGWVENMEGRKIFARGTVEDGEGGVMATGEALFIVVEKVKGRL